MDDITKLGNEELLIQLVKEAGIGCDKCIDPLYAEILRRLAAPSVSRETSAPQCSCRASLGDNADCKKHYPDSEAAPLSGEGGERSDAIKARHMFQEDVWIEKKAKEEDGADVSVIHAHTSQTDICEALQERLDFMLQHYCRCDGNGQWKVTCPYHVKFPHEIQVASEPKDKALLECPDCYENLILLSESGNMQHYACENKHDWEFFSVPLGHPYFSNIEQAFDLNDQHLARFGRRLGNVWDKRLLPVLYPCGCCCQMLIGYWCPEATAKFYICKAWPDKTPSPEIALRFHQKHDSSAGKQFICDECASHSKAAPSQSYNCAQIGGAVKEAKHRVNVDDLS